MKHQFIEWISVGIKYKLISDKEAHRLYELKVGKINFTSFLKRVYAENDN